jgi:hypothetical protein
MFFNLPLSADKDLYVNTTDKEPVQIVTRTHRIRLTKEEAEVLLDLLMRNGTQILQDMQEGR